MVTVDQMMIKDIPSSAVLYTLPICEVHNVIMRIVKTKRVNEERIRLLRVARMCRCDECHKLGSGDTPVINHRIFPT